MKTKIRTDLLRKLANHLHNPRTKRNKRKLDIFRFHTVAATTDCGTAGCALGELPYCFPKQWKITGRLSKSNPYVNLIPILRLWPEASSAVSAASYFFRLSYRTTKSLFMPSEQSPDGVLPNGATAEQVAAHIRKYCSKVEARRK